MSKLRLSYNKKQREFIANSDCKSDSMLILMHLLNDVLVYRIPSSDKPLPYNYDVFNLRQELAIRGYDLTTLKVSIEKLKTPSV